MLYGNQLGLKMFQNGLIDELPIFREKRHKKKFNCIKCGTVMNRIDNTNTMACPNCKNWFIFDK